VAERERGGVGGVGGPRGVATAEPGLHHLLHLLLVGAAPAGDGVLDLVGCVLDDVAARVQAASANARPLAWPTLIAVRTLTWKNTCSTATASGSNSSRRATSSPAARPGVRERVGGWSADDTE
jgi:hypothetical protein